MVKKDKSSLSFILLKKIKREIKTNFKQFLALILIAGLAVTLFVGLVANAKSLKMRVNSLYELGNIADIFVYSSDVNEADKNNLYQIEGVEKVETRFSLDECIIYRNSGTLMITPEENTMCVPAELEGTRGAVIDSMFASMNKDLQIGKEMKVSLSYSLEDLIGNSEYGKTLLALTDGFYVGEGVNPLREKLTIYPKITGFMKHPETIERKISNGTCLLDEGVFRELFHQFFVDNFTNPVGEIINEYFSKISIYDQYLIKVKDNYDIDEVNDQIYRYFNPNSYDDNSYDISSKYWGKYFGKDENENEYFLSIREDNIILNNQNYKVINVSNSIYYEIKKINGDEKHVLKIDDKGVDLLSNRYKVIASLTKDNNSSFVASITKANLPSNAVIEQDIYQSEQLCIVFPTIFFIVAALVLLTSLSQTIYRSRQEIGTMKAIGVPKSKILFHYISLGVVLSLIGAVLGTILGPLIITPIMNIKYSILYNLPAVKFIYPLDSILLCIGIFVILSALVTFSITISEVHLDPISSMRPKKNKDFKDSKNKNSKAVSTLRLSLRMAFRNIFSKKIRMFMVIFGVMGCTSLTVAGFGILDTIYYGLNMDLYDTYNAELTISYRTNHEQESYEILLNEESISYVQQTQTKVIRAQGEEKAIDTYLNLFEKNEFYNSYDFLDYINDGVAISNSTAEKLGIKVGDTVNLIYLGKSFQTTLQYTFESSYWLGIYAFSDSFLEMDFSPSGCFIKTKEGIKLDNYAEELKQRMINEEDTLFVGVNTVASIQKLVDDTVSSVKMMCNTVKVFAILLAMVVTYNLAALNFTERKRDIATLKVLGFASKEIGLSLVFELLLLTIVGVIGGLFLGFPILYLIMSINETNLLHYIYHISISTYFISASISLGTAILVNTYLAFMASKVDAVSALKSVE